MAGSERTVGLKEMCDNLSASVGEKCRACGERRKSRDQDFGDVAGDEDPFFRSSRIRLCGRGRALRSGGNRWSGIGRKETSGSWRSSRTSLIVNAPWTGPLRPTTRTFLILLLESVAKA